MKLNLGCGIKPLKGFTNIDKRKLPGVDLVYDLENKLPYTDKSVDTIYAIDVLEHFSYHLTDSIFADWVRVLKVGGNIKITVPDIDKHIKLYQTGAIDQRTGKPVDIHRLRHYIFGCLKYKGSAHYTTFNKKSIKELFLRNNLTCEIQHSRKGMIVKGEKLK